MKTAPIRLNFAARARPLNRTGTAMLVASLCALAAAGTALGLKLTEHARQVEKIADLDARLGMPRTRDPRARAPDPGELARLRGARSVARQLNTPWADLLDALESAPVKSVALLSIEPSVDKRSVRLTAEAGTPTDMLGYLAALQKDPRLSSATLASHQVQLQTPGTPVRFQIQAEWGSAP